MEKLLANSALTVGAVLFLAGALGSEGQPAFEATLSPAFEAFSGTVTRPDEPTLAGQLEAEYQAGALRAWYALGAASYVDQGEWASWLHGLGATLRLGGEERRLRAYAGATGTLRRNGSAWSQADYEGLGAFANVELKPAANLSLRGGYRFDARTFAGLPSLDQREHDLFVSLRANLASRTTLIGELHLGTKSYDGEPSTTVDSLQPTTHAPTGAGAAQAWGSSRGRRPTIVATPALPDGVPGGRAHQSTWLLRVAQSLADRTGLSLQVSQRATSGRVPPALVSTPTLFFDDGVYDDPFASDALWLRGALKHALARGGWLEASAGWTRKEYRGVPALDTLGSPLPDGALRTDRVWQAGLQASVPILLSRTGAWRVELQPAWRFTRSRSSDAYYDYTSPAAMLGLSVSY